MFKKIVLGVVIGLAVGFVLIQFLPYGRDHTNSAAGVEPQWDNPQTRDLVVRACYDCHSDQTTWPWYSNVAPISWLIQHDVQNGRSRLNFTQWNGPQRESFNAVRQVQSGAMPQWYYTVLHPTANLSSAEKQTLIQGLRTTLGGGQVQ